VPYDNVVEICNLNRPHIVAILASRARALGVRIEYEAEITSRAQLPDADVIVAADGAGSRMREESGLFGTTTRVTPDKYIWLGTDKSFGTFSYHFTPTSHGWIWASSYGMRSELSTFVVHCGAATWAGLGFDTMTTADGLALIGDLFRDRGEQALARRHGGAYRRQRSHDSLLRRTGHDARDRGRHRARREPRPPCQRRAIPARVRAAAQGADPVPSGPGTAKRSLVH